MQGLFTDVFKKLDVLKMASIDKQGEVSVAQDKTIGKRVLKVLGAVSSSNCVRVPSRKSKPLNLQGNYVACL
jgi:hypothetical protein